MGNHKVTKTQLHSLPEKHQLETTHLRKLTDHAKITKTHKTENKSQNTHSKSKETPPQKPYSDSASP